MTPSFFEKVKYKAKAAESADRWSKNLRFPHQSIEASQQAQRGLRAAFEAGFITATIEEKTVEDGLAFILAKAHGGFPPELTEEQIRKFDENMSVAFRLGFRAGMVAATMGRP